MGRLRRPRRLLPAGALPLGRAAGDAGLAPDGTGFRGVVLNDLVRSEERVAGVLAEAEAAGATIVKAAESSPWGGTSGFFADPDGYLWKVASGTGDQPFAE